jgi:hypothetical protein
MVVKQKSQQEASGDENALGDNNSSSNGSFLKLVRIVNDDTSVRGGTREISSAFEPYFFIKREHALW